MFFKECEANIRLNHPETLLKHTETEYTHCEKAVKDEDLRIYHDMIIHDLMMKSWCLCRYSWPLAALEGRRHCPVRV